MRARPKIHVRFSPGHVAPGMRLEVEVELLASQPTPIDFVHVALDSELVWDARFRMSLFAREWRSPAGKLAKGTQRYRVAFDLPATLPPTYAGVAIAVTYTLAVHVSIPWWPDQRRSFLIPVAFPHMQVPPPSPRAYATSVEGPRGTEPFMEVALDSTTLAVGDVLTGSLSLANLRGKHVRAVELAIGETELVPAAMPFARDARKYAVRILSSTPREGEPIPFRFRTSPAAVPALQTHALVTSSYFEARAIVAWGDDIVLRAPLLIAAGKREGGGTGWVAPVGRRRRAGVLAAVAERAGLSADADELHGMRGVVSLRIREESRDADLWLVAELTWPGLGMALEVGERGWLAVFASKPDGAGVPDVDRRLVVRARESAQARALVGFLGACLVFEEVRVHDDGAVLASRGSGHSQKRVEAFVHAVLVAASALDEAIPNVPPPEAFAADVPAWRAFAERIRGRLVVGGMSIHDGRIGTDRLDVATSWGTSGRTPQGAAIGVLVDPPLEGLTSIDAPTVSAAARDIHRELVSKVARVGILPTSITLFLGGKLADPETVMPAIELAVRLRRALSGAAGSGPFR